MATTDVNSTGVWYHLSRADRDSAARWAQGAARKGVYDAKRSLSIIAFSAEEIAEAIGDSPLPQAQLILRRDAAYGEAEVTVSVAPLRISEMPTGYMTYSQCMELARREIHRCISTSGTTALLDLPGSMLRALKNGEVNAFMIYQEEDGASSYARFSTSAALRIYADTDWHTPVWTRAVSAGDVISSKIFSHVAELREIEYYINVRLTHDSLPEMDDIGDGIDLGAYSDWHTVIARLRAGVDTYKAEESQDPVEWIPLTAGALPKAEAVEQLRSVIRGDDRERIESLPGFTATQRATTSAKVWNLQAGVKWPYDEAPQAGQTQGQVEVSGEGGRPTVVTMYDNHCCGWIFERDEEVAVTAATVEIKVTESEAEHNPHITLYGVKLRENTDGYKRYTEVFDDTVIGEADCVVGDVTYILINAAGKQLMNSRTIHGIGVRYDSEHVVFAKTAALLINNEAEETTPADEPAEQGEENSP